MLQTVLLGGVLIIREVLTEYTCLFHVLNTAQGSLRLCVQPVYLES